MAVDAEQDDRRSRIRSRRGMLRFCSHDDAPGIEKGPGEGPLGFAVTALPAAACS